MAKQNMNRGKLSRRQQTIHELFPQRLRESARAALSPQLAFEDVPFGPDLGFTLGHGAERLRNSLKMQRCPLCVGLLEGRTCDACNTYVCIDCESWTSPNGGDGTRCYHCMCAPSGLTERR